MQMHADQIILLGDNYPLLRFLTLLHILRVRHWSFILDYLSKDVFIVEGNDNVSHQCKGWGFLTTLEDRDSILLHSKEEALLPILKGSGCLNSRFLSVMQPTVLYGPLLSHCENWDLGYWCTHTQKYWYSGYC